jgi:ComF family protein
MKCLVIRAPVRDEWRHSDCMPWAAHICQPRFQQWVDRSRRRLARALWPSNCILCGGAGDEDIDLCRDCAADLPRNEPPCAPPFSSSFVPFRYAYPLDHLVRGLKYRNELACGRVLGQLFAKRLLEARAPLPEAIVPVPLAPGRYRQRGYNQASELALPIRRATGLELRSDIVIRQRETIEQAGLDRKARLRNVTGAFAAVAPLHARHVAILDDVVTTGSTVRELAQVLRQAGAERIAVWAIARTEATG